MTAPAATEVAATGQAAWRHGWAEEVFSLRNLRDGGSRCGGVVAVWAIGAWWWHGAVAGKAASPVSRGRQPHRGAALPEPGCSRPMSISPMASPMRCGANYRG